MDVTDIRRLSRLFQRLLFFAIAGTIVWGWRADAGVERTGLAAIGSMLFVLACLTSVVLVWSLTAGRRHAAVRSSASDLVVSSLWFVLFPVGATLLGSVAWAAARAPDWSQIGPRWVTDALWAALGCGVGIVLGWPIIQRMLRRTEARAKWSGVYPPESGTGI